MDPMPVILDISSDEEMGLSEPQGGDGDGDDFDWISKLFDGADDKEPGNDSDDVVVLGESINTNRKSKSSKSTMGDTDDDCVILEGDPDNPIAVVDDAVGGSDELNIVGEKGQIACRDYPHPRHHCAKYPFSSTPHERHCEQCHCYICESLAPCLHWVTGISNVDHCHATDKEEIWKIKRKSFKLGGSAPLPGIKSSDASLPAALAQLQAQLLDNIPLAPNPMPQNQVSRPNIIRACSKVASYAVPNIIGQGRSQQPASVLVKTRTHPRLVSPHLLGVRNSVIQRDRAMTVGNAGPGFVPSHTMFKKTGAVRGALPMHPSVYSSSDNVNRVHAALHTINATPTAVANDRNLVRWPNVHPSLNLESYGPQDFSQPNVGGFVTHIVSSQPQTDSQSIAQSNDGKNFCQHVYQSQNASQGIYQKENQPLNASQNIWQHGSQSLVATDAGFSDFSFSWPINSCQSNQHLINEDSQVHGGGSVCEPYPVEESNSQFMESTCRGRSTQRPEYFGSANLSQNNQEPPVDSSRLENTGSLCEPSTVKEANCQFSGNLNSNTVDFSFDDWFMENQPVPVVSGGSVPSELNLYSPETSSIDAEIGLLQQYPAISVY
ncbi:uncharacterized protein LOC121250353 isoform X3 [Juglans microcarpa x Juglans regia]|uniref:uncharacterized protein LOC121250353 isoform X3 n=1 Tax=Juglans microcarpa x Juglans regia TaxID=2249226 RepID=UPI001B7F07A4|nr:uncharacterized protein LOC121250353 isoform X3 [Juglans microcarpa x Juglans regia]